MWKKMKTFYRVITKSTSNNSFGNSKNVKNCNVDKESEMNGFVLKHTPYCSHIDKA